jgi:hypothetical protein
VGVTADMPCAGAVKAFEFGAKRIDGSEFDTAIEARESEAAAAE